jgi:hypothetical protein
MPATLQEIREAFTYSGGASNLTPRIIDRLLNELKRMYGPLYRAIPHQTWLTPQFIFNQRTGLPLAQHTTEAPPTSGAGSVAPTNSTFNQKVFNVKHTQSNLDISTFAAKVATVNGPLFDIELLGAAKAMEWLDETTHMFGNEASTINTARPQWDGIDYQIASANKVDAGTSLLALKYLDNAIDAVRGPFAGELGTDWFFAMTPSMQSFLNGLFVNQQRFNAVMGKALFKTRDDYGDVTAPVADSSIDAGVEVQTYRGIPIVFSSFLSSVGSMTTVSVSSNNTGSGGGLLAANTYYYVIEAVTKYGLTTASAEVSSSPSADGKSIVLSWTTPTPTDSLGNTIDIIGYRIFRSTTSGAESLYAVSAAYDLKATDAAVTSWTDTGLAVSPSINSAGIPQTTTTYSATISTSGTAASDGVTFPRVQTGSQKVEDIWLIPRNPEFLVSVEVNPIETQMLAPVNARTRQFSLTSDKTLAMRAAPFGAKISRVRYA